MFEVLKKVLIAICIVTFWGQSIVYCAESLNTQQSRIQKIEKTCLEMHVSKTNKLKRISKTLSITGSVVGGAGAATFALMGGALTLAAVLTAGSILTGTFAILLGGFLIIPTFVLAGSIFGLFLVSIANAFHQGALERQEIFKHKGPSVAQLKSSQEKISEILDMLFMYDISEKEEVLSYITLGSDVFPSKKALEILCSIQ